MRARLMVAAFAVLGLSETAGAEIARSLRGESLREAIAYGRSAPSGLDQYDLLRERAYVVNFDTPFLRVAQLAHAMKEQNVALEEAALPAPVTADVVHLYIHARHETGDNSSFRDVEQVVIARPRDGMPPELVSPSAFQSFVRRVPVAADYDGPTRLARSVKVVFPVAALATGAEIRIRFVGGGTQVVKLQPEMLAQYR